MLEKDILKKALKNENTIVVNEVINGTKMKFIGPRNLDLYIYTNKNYIQKIISKNIFNIKNTVYAESGRIVRNVYLDNVLVDMKIKKLDSLETIEKIDIDNISTIEDISGENNIISNIFAYDTSILNKSKITISLYNKELNKEFNYKLTNKHINGFLSKGKRKKIIKEMRELIKLQYFPNNNDTKEFIKMFL